MLYGSVLVLITVLLIFIGVKQNRGVESDILSVLLRYGEMYGLQIADAIEQDFGRKPGWGVLYPGLRRLERQGFVVARWGEERPDKRGGARRRYYRRTGKRKNLVDRKSANLWWLQFQHLKDSFLRRKPCYAKTFKKLLSIQDHQKKLLY